MGLKQSGNYEYFGFKQNGGTSWYIMRHDITDDSAWLYSYSTPTGHTWTVAWGTPGGETYTDPPNT